jgi:3-dehydroquinate dehydratase/shikimate dehydrogenase
MGEGGKWTRLLGLARGAFLTYASLETGNETAPGQVTVRDMIDLYRVKKLDEQTEVYGIIAGDTTYSMSPYIHNAAFVANEINAVFVPFQVIDLDAFIARMVQPKTREVELNLRGFSVTNPHKRSVVKHLDHLDDAAAMIGAVNTIKIVDGKLYGFNTDWEGFLGPLKKAVPDLTGARVAVAGAGGAARACVYALKNAGADVTVFARDIEKAKNVSDDFGVRVETLRNGTSDPATSFAGFDVVVNTTPLGTRGDKIGEAVASAEQLNGVGLVYDLVYNPSQTKFMQEAKQVGARTIGGFDMLIAQAARQFEIWTGNEPPIDEMSAAARKRLDEN